MGLAPDPAHIYTAEYVTKLQEALDESNKFEDICDVRYINTRQIINPYGTDATPASNTRSCQYTWQGVRQTTDSVTISSFYIDPQFIDRADLAQSTFQNQMDIAQRQATNLKEQIESAVYTELITNTDMGTETFANGSGSTAITVSTVNIDEIIRAVKREIREANGEAMANRNGIFIVWRPADFEMLEQVMQANGFVMADEALRNGVRQGINYMGVTHYSSNILVTAGSSIHVVAGVKKTTCVAVLKDTYGQIVTIQDPDNRSGVGIVSRVDWGVQTWLGFTTINFDINVS